jgi:hypothetical protein
VVVDQMEEIEMVVPAAVDFVLLFQVVQKLL